MYATIQQHVMTLAYAFHDKHQFYQKNGMDVWNGTECRCHRDTLNTSDLSHKGSSEKRIETRTTYIADVAMFPCTVMCALL